MTDAEAVRWYQCERKERFDDFTTAEERALRIERTQRVHHEVSAYECTHCRGFHVGRARWTMTPGRQQADRARKLLAKRSA